MPRFAVVLSYDGTAYNGWQIQDNTPNTIQQILQDKARILFRCPIELIGCGRTDTGVHAENFVAHFDVDDASFITSLADPVYKWNALLPDDIVIHDLFEVQPLFHSRFDAVERTYHYHLHQRPNPFIRRFSYYQYGRLDFDKMNMAAETLLKHKDFTSFSKLHTDNDHNLCDIHYARWLPLGNHKWKFVIRANRFLRGMVRSVVGTLLWVGKDKITVDEFEQIILSKDRMKAGPNVPAHGLILTAVKYPFELKPLEK
ncbi:MAG: tRNA pseudouridine(38-40) synthase TruA [Bacteroidia bacterium]|nr:tRNA pseudouridine(38-40) synthase TruA [Bacteroidia bacterium]